MSFRNWFLNMLPFGLNVSAEQYIWSGAISMIDLKLSTNRKVSWASLRKEESESDLSSQSAMSRDNPTPSHLEKSGQL